ncbi:MAG: prolipoprotein diacylglyceryl transferase [Chloroflexi bacterium]|nr:prolipoprotein diacylglyceryl transferase [Chloroflexota bacterium]
MSGITINIDPVIVHLGGFAVRWYGLTFAGGIGVAILLVLREAKRRGLNTDKVANLAIGAVIGGLVGARLFHVVDRLDDYLANPIQVFRVYQGGMAIWGGLVTGGVVAVFLARRNGLPIGTLADASVIGMLAGQMVGRLGCIVNGDAYGGPTGMPWGFVYVNPGAMIPEALKGIPTHPYPVYEILWDLALLGLLLFLRRRELPAGMLFLTYVAGYAIARFTLTFVRQEAVWLWGLQEAQVVAMVTFIAAMAGAVYVLRARAPAARRSSASSRRER